MIASKQDAEDKRGNNGRLYNLSEKKRDNNRRQRFFFESINDPSPLQQVLIGTFVSLKLLSRASSVFFDSFRGKVEA